MPLQSQSARQGGSSSIANTLGEYLAGRSRLVPAESLPGGADFNSDGVTDTRDLVEFVREWTEAR